MRKRLNNEKGLSLIEVIAATVLLSMVLFTFLTMFLIGIKIKSASEEVFDASYYVQAEIESVIALKQTGTLNSFEQRLVNQKGYTRSGNTYTRKVEEVYVIELRMIDRPTTAATVMDIVITMDSDTVSMAPVKMETTIIWRNTP